MHGKHLRRRGQWRHYYRNRPKRYADIEPRPVFTFALDTTSISEAKLKAAEISVELETQWADALRRGHSLSSQNANERYAAALATTRHHGLPFQTPHDMNDDVLLERLRLILKTPLP